jgi:hypothetical protein
MSEIDPVQFGALTAQVSAQGKEIAELRLDVKNLLELANKSKGGFLAGMALASAASSVLTYIIGVFFHK